MESESKTKSESKSEPEPKPKCDYCDLECSTKYNVTRHYAKCFIKPKIDNLKLENEGLSKQITEHQNVINELRNELAIKQNIINDLQNANTILRNKNKTKKAIENDLRNQLSERCVTIDILNKKINKQRDDIDDIHDRYKTNYDIANRNHEQYIGLFEEVIKIGLSVQATIKNNIENDNTEESKPKVNKSKSKRKSDSGSEPESKPEPKPKPIPKSEYRINLEKYYDIYTKDALCSNASYVRDGYIKQFGLVKKGLNIIDYDDSKADIDDNHKIFTIINKLHNELIDLPIKMFADPRNVYTIINNSFKNIVKNIP